MPLACSRLVCNFFAPAGGLNFIIKSPPRESPFKQSPTSLVYDLRDVNSKKNKKKKKKTKLDILLEAASVNGRLYNLTVSLCPLSRVYLSEVLVNPLFRVYGELSIVVTID